MTFAANGDGRSMGLLRPCFLTLMTISMPRMSVFGLRTVVAQVDLALVCGAGTGGESLRTCTDVDRSRTASFSSRSDSTGMPCTGARRTEVS